MDSSPAQYPKHSSYKHIISSILTKRQAEGQQSAQSPGIKSDNTFIRADICPSFALCEGEEKMIYYLKNGGRLTILKKKTPGQISYALRCPDGRCVFLEKGDCNASLSLTDKNGKTVKTLACEY